MYGISGYTQVFVMRMTRSGRITVFSVQFFPLYSILLFDGFKFGYSAVSVRLQGKGENFSYNSPFFCFNLGSI
jgi:hypothetical protein